MPNTEIKPEKHPNSHVSPPHHPKPEALPTQVLHELLELREKVGKLEGMMDVLLRQMGK